MNWHLLKIACTDLLKAELPEELKQAIDDKLSIGWQREALWMVLQLFMFDAGLKDWQLMYLAVHAYLFPEVQEVPPYPQNWTSRTPPRLSIGPQTRS